MKNTLVKFLIVFMFATSALATSEIASACCAWRNGHRVCWNCGYRHYSHCRWVEGHWSHGYWIRGHRVCFY